MSNDKSIVLGAESGLLIAAAQRFVQRTPGLSLVATTTNLAEVPDLVQTHRPSLVALDGSSGVLGLGSVFPVGFRDNFRRMNVVVLVPEVSDRSFLEAHEIGADAIVATTGRGRVIREVLESLDGDEAFFSHKQLESVRARYSDSVEFKFDQLDVCDREILKLLAIGLADKEIADSVYLAHQTVRNRVSHLFKTFGTRNRVELAILLCKSGVLLQSNIGHSSAMAQPRMLG